MASHASLRTAVIRPNLRTAANSNDQLPPVETAVTPAPSANLRRLPLTCRRQRGHQLLCSDHRWRGYFPYLGAECVRGLKGAGFRASVHSSRRRRPRRHWSVRALFSSVPVTRGAARFEYLADDGQWVSLEEAPEASGNVAVKSAQSVLQPMAILERAEEDRKWRTKRK